jgi:predicted small secreted protein
MAIPLGLAILACTACNTTKGVGKDVEAAGEGLQEVADDSKDAMTD